MNEYASYVGIDVSKDALEVHVLPGAQRFSEPNDAAGVAALGQRLSGLGGRVLVVMEATNVYWRLAAVQLSALGLAVAVINPRQGRDFAKALGRMAKTDGIDAEVLALFAQRIEPPVRALPSEQCEQARELVSRQGQLMGMYIAEKNRLSTARAQRVREDIRATVAFLNQRLKALDQDIDAWLRTTEVDQSRADLLVSFKGIGTRTARTLLILVPELGQLSAKQISALIGLAPMARDSGAQRGQRHIGGGRANVRAALYMPALTAIRCNPVMRSFYQRLKQAGKHHYVAIAACMHKMVIILNAMLKSGRPWQPVQQTT
jgi:transposase